MNKLYLSMLCVVALSADAQTFTTLAQFDGTNGGYVGYNPLIQGEDGNFYGATSGYYVHFKFPGTVFKVAPSGTLTTVQSLRNSDPYAGVLQATDGNLYGTTVYAGSHGDGRIFGIVPDGTLSTLFSFTGHDGSNPEGQLIQTSSGTIYGTTYAGGPKEAGAIFRYTPGGALRKLYAFCSRPHCTDGANPMAALAEATDGNFYGTTNQGGNTACENSVGCGTVFKITTHGKFTNLYAFCSQPNCMDGASPYSGLIEGTGGDLYGTTVGDSPACNSGCGTIYRITTAGALTTLYTFPNEVYPYAGLVQASDGNLYGTTIGGGANGTGSIFKLTPDGTFTTVYSFGLEHRSPLATMIQGTDGNFYGTTSGYLPQSKDYGSVYSFSAGLGPFVKTLLAAGKVGAAVTILGTNLFGATGVSFSGTPAAFTVNSTGSAIAATVPQDATTGKIQVTLPGGSTLTSNAPFRVLR